jgi:hypothetical protein
MTKLTKDGRCEYCGEKNFTLIERNIWDAKPNIKKREIELSNKQPIEFDNIICCHCNSEIETDFEITWN